MPVQGVGLWVMLVAIWLATAPALLVPAARAAAPVGVERDIADITPWLEPFTPAPDPDGRSLPAGVTWQSIELANPTNRELRRIVTVDPGSGGILAWLGGAAGQRIRGTQVAGEGGRTVILDLDGGQAVEVILSPLATVRFGLAVDTTPSALSWRLWRPEALAASQRAQTLIMGLLAGATLVMIAWLLGLAVLRNAAEPAWGACGLLSLMLLSLGQSVLGLPFGILCVIGAAMFACGIRYLVTHLDWDARRPRLAVLADGGAFAIAGFSLLAAAGVPSGLDGLQYLVIFIPPVMGLLVLRDALRAGARARALVPGLLILTAATVLPLMLPVGLLAGITSPSLFFDAMITAGALALCFAAAMPEEPEVDDQTREQLSEEGRKAREAEYRYALGLAAAHQGLWDWNFDSDTLFVSPSVEALLGLDAGALGSSERRWADLIVKDDIQTYADAMNAHRRQGNSSFTLEVRMRHAKGGIRWLQLRASCVADQRGRAIRCIGVVSDITARKNQETQRQTDESADPVTGLMLRNAFLKRLDGVLATMKSAQVRRHGAVLAIDVDRLRAVTDSMGHDAGDRFLAQVARRLDHAVGPDDAVARLGSDEFAVLALGMPGDEDGAGVAQRIRNALTQPVAVGSQEIYPAASIGLALIEPGHHYGSDVLREAEVAMYHAKRSGRGGFEIYQPEMKPRSADRLTMDADLRTALDREQIEIHYQPIIRLEDNSVAGFEALMRWRHPQRGILSPSEFIPLAEETGLIVPLGSYAVKRAAAELRRWQLNFPRREPLFCSVNVSARQLLRDEFFDDVIHILDTQQPARLSLKLELTESVIMQNPESMADALAHLKDQGAGLSLDDFGTGFSSLAYLQRFPFDTVKIDRSFVTDMAHNEETPVVLRSIIRLAHDLDMSVVAEGVETNSEAASLRNLQCEFAQGFLFGAPMTATAAYNFISAGSRGGPPAPRGLPRPGSGPARIPRKL